MARNELPELFELRVHADFRKRGRWMGFGFVGEEAGRKEAANFREIVGDGLYETAKAGKHEVEGVDLFSGVQVHQDNGKGDEEEDGEEGPEEGIEEGRVG